MLEEEAKSKWCPFARVGSAYQPGFSINRVVKETCCIASCCMAWRVTSEVTGRGFCGLAGRPLA